MNFVVNFVTLSHCNMYMHMIIVNTPKFENFLGMDAPEITPGQIDLYRIRHDLTE